RRDRQPARSARSQAEARLLASCHHQLERSRKGSPDRGLFDDRATDAPGLEAQAAGSPDRGLFDDRATDAPGLEAQALVKAAIAARFDGVVDVASGMRGSRRSKATAVPNADPCDLRWRDQDVGEPR